MWLRRELYGLIGPHEGNELALMLSGDKPMARFTVEQNYTPDTKAFQPHVEAGRIVEIRVPIERGGECLYYCLPGEEWRVKLSLFVLHQSESNLTAEDLHKMDGFLLSYDKKSINDFVEHWRAHEPKPQV
jgi:hypothetical protein